MKKIFLLLLSVVLLIAASNALAADAPKIGLIDLQRALNESEAGKKAKSDLESLIKSKETIVDEKRKAIEKLKGEIEKQASVLSAEAKKAREEEMERLLRDYQRLVADAQAEVKKKEGELTGAIIRDVREIINKIGQEEGYTLILETAEGLILYSKKELDITDMVIKNYNELKAKPKK